MAMGTTSEHKDNPQMHAPGTPGAAPHSTDPRDPSLPWLDPDDDKVDWVLLLRCYPHAKSKAELRAAAMKAGEEAGKAAAAAKANKDAPMSEQATGEPPMPQPRH